MVKSKFDRLSITAVLIFFVLAIYWTITQVFPQYNIHHELYSFSTVYGLLALFGAIVGIKTGLKWGGLRTVIGRAIIMFSLGLLAQEFGQVVYSYYYIALHLPSADYPSLGDVGFFGSIPLYCYGVILLGKASGATLRFKSVKHVLPAILITFAILAIGYILFLQQYTFDWSNSIKIFLDFGYPLGEAVYVSLAISAYLLSKGVLGGVMKSKILFIFFALCVQFVADYTFLYQTVNGTWVDGGVNEFTYLIAYLVMTLALLQFKIAYEKLQHKSSHD